MNKWLPEYTLLTKQNIDQLLKDYGVTREDVDENHPVTQELERRLQQVENIWAAQDKRPPAQVHLTIAQSTFGPVQLTPEEQWKTLTFHDFVAHTHQIPWHPNAFGMSELELLDSMRHETEHGAQSVGFGYTEQEKQLIWIERACKTRTEDYYWVRFSEMTARMKEAEFCIDMLQNHKSHLTAPDRQNLLYTAESVLRRLTYQCTKTDLAKLQKAQKRFLHYKSTQTPYLEKVLNGSHRQQNAKAYQFLKNIAPTLYKEYFERLQATREQLAQYVTEWQQSIPNAVKRYEHNQENERLQELAQQYGIPVLTELPESVHTMPIHGDSHAEQYIKQKKHQEYNAALVVFSNKPAQLIYDTERVPRPYSISPSLRMQWQVENMLPEIDVPADIEHGDDERFDD